MSSTPPSTSAATATGPAADLAARLVTTAGCWGPSLTAAADQLAFVSDRGGRPQLWIVDLDDRRATARPVPLSDDPVLAVDWSPDGSWLACSVASGGGVRTEVWVVRPDGSDARRVAGGDGRHARLGPWLRHGHRLVVGRPPAGAGDVARSVTIDPERGTEELLAEGGLLDVLDVSADERLAILRDGTRGAQFCVVLDRAGDVDHPLLTHPGTGATPQGILRPAPSSKGDRDQGDVIAYVVTDAGRPRNELVGIPLTADGLRKGAGTLASRADADLEWLDADDFGQQLILGWNVGGRSEVELVETTGWRRWQVSGLPGAVVTGGVMARGGDRTVLCVEGPEQPPSLVVLDHATGSTRPVADAWTPPVDGLVRPTLETFESHDGLPMSGWLYRPPGADGPGPALLSFHGGPEAEERPVWNPQHQCLVAVGITVFAPNVRGSSGFGRGFVHADDRSGRRDAIADVDACAAHLLDRGVAAPGRIAVSGRSYGGYLTLAAMVAFPDVFAAGVDICGMSDLRTFFERTEPWIAAAAVTKYGDPESDRALLEELSPLPRADRIAAPLLVVHGELDTNVPVSEAHQIVGALRDLGRPVEYLELAGEGHEYRSTAGRLALLEALLRFLPTTLGAP